MTGADEEIYSAEYASLRNELLQNKQFVFERPLAIIGATGIALAQLSGTPTALVLPILLILLMWVNLWFTVNRLRSNARISAYIAVVMERNRQNWIGWESSLRLHRIWSKKHSRNERESSLSSQLDPAAIPDSMMFYPLLYWLHLLMVVCAAGASVLSLGSNPGLTKGILTGITLAAATGFCALCVGPYRPRRMSSLIEIQHATWIRVLNLQRGEPKNALEVTAEPAADDLYRVAEKLETRPRHRLSAALWIACGAALGVSWAILLTLVERR